MSYYNTKLQSSNVHIHHRFEVTQSRCSLNTSALNIFLAILKMKNLRSHGIDCECIDITRKNRQNLPTTQNKPIFY